DRDKGGPPMARHEIRRADQCISTSLVRAGRRPAIQDDRARRPGPRCRHRRLEYAHGAEGMSTWKEILFGILAILLMGIAGEMDYQDAKRAEAAAMEEWR